MIRTSKHTFKFANLAKKRNVSLFLREYHRILNIFIDYIWNNEIVHKYKDEAKTFNVLTKNYECPMGLVKEICDKIDFDTQLSARALKCCSNQACSTIRGVLEKPKRYQYVLNKLLKEGKSTTEIRKSISELKITKPIVRSPVAELCSICCGFKETEKHFDGFLELKSIGKSFGRVRIPVKFHRQSNKWKSKGKIMKSFLISENSIEIRWENEFMEKKSDGEVVGADQGLRDILTLSNGVVTKKSNEHGYSLEKIVKVLSRKRKGSRAFRKAQDHRKNFINWSINQLNLNNIKEIRAEKIVNIGYKKKRSRYLKHWTSTLIRDKLSRLCEEIGVQFSEQSSVYRSQRCSVCGWVQKKNRKSGGKVFCCVLCQHHSDADLNAAKNHLIDLPDIPFSFRELKLNKNGFFWNPDGFRNLIGEVFAVPLSLEK